MSTSLIIAIDGSSGAGKSSTARTLAQRLQCLYCDTGAHYRTVTHLLQTKAIPYTDYARVESTLATWNVENHVQNGASELVINHRPVEDTLLRTAIVNAEVSYYAALPCVRQFLFPYQKSQASLATRNGFRGLVIEGRDIGLNIFPNTPFKYYLHADPLVKQRRRAADGITDATDLRDMVDRTYGQFQRAANAIDIDTTTLTLPQVVDFLASDIQKKLATLS